MSSLKSRIPLPAQSRGRQLSQMQQKLRRTRSVSSTTSNTSVRLTEVISDSFQIPLPKRQSVLNDDTNIEVFDGIEWWKRLGNNSRDVTTIMNEQENEDINAKNVAEEMDIDCLSQEKENFTLDLPESSDNESIRSIVMPHHKLFIHKDNQPHRKYKGFEKNNETLANMKKSYFAEDKEIDVRPKKLFNQMPKTKPVFNADLLTVSVNETIQKSVPNINIFQVQNIFGKGPEIQSKNIYADFIATDSEDEIPELQSKFFRFQMNTKQKRKISQASEQRPSIANTTDSELDSWKHLPSSTMVDGDSDELGTITPLKKSRLSRISKTTENNISLNQHSSSKKFKKPNLPGISNDLSNSKTGGVGHNVSINQYQNQNFDKTTNKTIVSKNKSATQESLKEVHDSELMQNISLNMVQGNINQVVEDMPNINFIENENTLTKLQGNGNRKESKQEENKRNKEYQVIEIEAKINQTENKCAEVNHGTKPQQKHQINEEENEIVNMNSAQMQNILVHKTLIQANDNQLTEDMVDINSKQNENILTKLRGNQNKRDQEENQVIEIQAQINQRENISAEVDNGMKLLQEDQINQEHIERLKGNQVMEDEKSSQKNWKENNSNREYISTVEEGERTQTNQELNKCDKENHILIHHEKEKIESDIENADNEVIQSENENESEVKDKTVEQNHESDVERDATIQEQLNESQELNYSQSNETLCDQEDETTDCEQEIESHEDEYLDQEDDAMESYQDEQNKSIDEVHEDIDSEEPSPNVTHDKSGTRRKKSELATKTPEVVLHSNNHREFSPVLVRKSSISKKTPHNPLNIRSITESLYSDSVNSSTGSGWDSHRTLRKTLGKEFSPRKSLRNLVLEKTARRQTNYIASKSKRQTEFNDMPKNDTRLSERDSDVIQLVSYPDPEAVEVDETVEESTQDSEALTQMQLENYMQRIRQKHVEEQRKMQEEVKNTLKSIAGAPYNPFKMPELPKKIRRVAMSTMKKPRQPKTRHNDPITEDMLPPEFAEDLKYKPKRFKGANAAWITKRLYNYLEKKLEPKYDYRARLRAEKLVQTLYEFARRVRPLPAAPQPAVDALKLEMARLNIVNTHYEFYNFFHDYMPREITIRVNPYIMNKMPVPRNVFGDIIPREQS